MKIKLILTFDYELPLGGCTSFDQGLFKPSEELLALANELKVPIVLFADICCALRFKEWDYDFFNSFRQQIHHALETGHDIQLHIHPHWMDSSFENGQFIPSARFGLSDFKNENQLNIENIISTSLLELEKICREVKADYQCIAYRAGGYNVEPESRRILTALSKLGVLYDSSVMPGFFQDYSFSKIDYRKAPLLNTWKVPLQGPLISTTNNAPYIKELPISTMPNSILRIIKRRIYKILHKKKIAQRKYVNSGKGFKAAAAQSGIFTQLRMMGNPIVLTFDQEHLNAVDLMKIVDYQIQTHHEQEEIFITLISHPKSMRPYHLQLMREFIENLRSRFQNQIEFITYSHLRQND